LYIKQIIFELSCKSTKRKCNTTAQSVKSNKREGEKGKAGEIGRTRID